MANCSSLALQKAVILHQEDYHLARLMFDDLESLSDAKGSVNKAVQIARGFGIQAKDIVEISDMTAARAGEAFAKVKAELKSASELGRRTFLFVYCSGYGVNRKGRHVLLNSSQGSLFNVEQECTDILSSTNSSILSIYDCVDATSKFRDLRVRSKTINNFIDETSAGSRSSLLQVTRREGQKYALADELLEHLQLKGADAGAISLPQDLQDFESGAVSQFQCSNIFNLEWNPFNIVLSDEEFFYSSRANEESLGEREETTFDFMIGATKDSYTGEWMKGTETRHGKGQLENADGTKYVGYFAKNKFNGKGKYTFAKSDSKGRDHYIGWFQNGEFHGMGAVHLKNGEWYQANFNRGQPVGQGKLLPSDLSIWK